MNKNKKPISITVFCIVISSILQLLPLSELMACTLSANNTYSKQHREETALFRDKATFSEDVEKVDSILTKAISLIDNQEYLEAERRLCQAIDHGVDDIRLHYEAAWCLYCMKNYVQAAEKLSNLIKRSDATAELFQLLGNALDMAGRRGEAYDAYRRGLALFPSSACLYLELGNMKAGEGDYRNAILLYEEGISHQPDFASNYYRAALLFLNSTEEVWGMAYGELFMLLEKNDAERLKNISSRLYEAYQANISFKKGGEVHIGFDTDVIRYSDSPSRPNCYPEIYRELMQQACKGERHCDLAALYRIRQRFNSAFGREASAFENVLSEYHNKIISAGHFEAYTYWLLGYGNTAQAATWIKENKAKWTAFLQWYDQNPIEIKPQNAFTRRNME